MLRTLQCSIRLFSHPIRQSTFTSGIHARNLTGGLTVCREFPFQQQSFAAQLFHGVVARQVTTSRILDEVAPQADVKQKKKKNKNKKPRKKRIAKTVHQSSPIDVENELKVKTGIEAKDASLAASKGELGLVEAAAAMKDGTSEVLDAKRELKEATSQLKKQEQKLDEAEQQLKKQERKLDEAEQQLEIAVDLEQRKAIEKNINFFREDIISLRNLIAASKNEIAVKEAGLTEMRKLAAASNSRGEPFTNISEALGALMDTNRTLTGEAFVEAGKLRSLTYGANVERRSDTMPFLGRDAPVKAILQHVMEVFKVEQGRPRYPIKFLQANPGGGKTRLLHEICIGFQEFSSTQFEGKPYELEIAKKVLVMPIEMNGNTPLIEDVNILGLVVSDVEIVVGLRLAFIWLTTETNYASFLRKIKQAIGSGSVQLREFGLDKVVSAIRSRVGRECFPFLLVDESLKFNQMFPHVKPDTFYRSLARMQDVDRSSRLCVLFSALDASIFPDMVSSTDRPVEGVPLPALDLKFVADILTASSLSQIEDLAKATEVPEADLVRLLASLCGGHMRVLQLLCDGLHMERRFTHETYSDVVRETIVAIGRRYQEALQTDMFIEPVLMALYGRRVNCTKTSNPQEYAKVCQLLGNGSLMGSLSVQSAFRADLIPEMSPLMLMAWASQSKPLNPQSDTLFELVNKLVQPLIVLDALKFQDMVQKHFEVMSQVFAATGQENSFVRSDEINWTRASILERFPNPFFQSSLSPFWTQARFDWTQFVPATAQKVNSPADFHVNLKDMVSGEGAILFLEAKMSFPGSSTSIDLNKDVIKKSARIVKGIDSRNQSIVVMQYYRPRRQTVNYVTNSMKSNVIVFDGAGMKLLLGPTLDKVFSAFVAISATKANDQKLKKKPKDK